MPYRGVKRAVWRAYTEFEERSLQWMVDRSLTFANGPALAAKHSRPGRPVIETTTTTIGESDISNRDDTCTRTLIRLLTVSRIDPRKGLRILPRVVRLLVDRHLNVALDIVGPTVGGPGERERDAIIAEATRAGVVDRVSLIGAVALDQLLPMYARYDAFVLPTLPGEGIPRVLLEAMSSGLPVVTTRVAGIPGLVTNERNGLLVDDPSAEAVAAALARIVFDQSLRQGLIAHGYETARRFTLDAQAARMMDAASRGLHFVLRRPAIVPVA
jgi:glycosyltransferase involved in cell wall biosynthesis